MPNSDKTTVLIVDDEEDVLRPIAFRLEAQGFRVLLEPDGELGFQTAVAKRPDLILLDVMMPGMDGLALCAILKEREDTGAIPIIILTAKTALADVEKVFRSGADDYVAKPFEWDELHEKINRCLAHSAMPQA
jgi:DNA-binding response OmpR family regulator